MLALEHVDPVKTLTKPHVVEEVRPSFQGDGNSPVAPFKSILVRTFAPNCPGEGVAAMEALIDTVWVNP